MVEAAVGVEPHNRPLEVCFEPIKVLVGFWELLMRVAKDIFELRDFIAQVERERGAVFATTEADDMATRPCGPICRLTVLICSHRSLLLWTRSSNGPSSSAKIMMRW